MLLALCTFHLTAGSRVTPTSNVGPLSPLPAGYDCAVVHRSKSDAYREEVAAINTEDPCNLQRITTDPSICHGKPIIRGMRWPVETLLELLASGMSPAEIIADHPELELQDIQAALQFATDTIRGRIMPAATIFQSSFVDTPDDDSNPVIALIGSIKDAELPSDFAGNAGEYAIEAVWRRHCLFHTPANGWISPEED